MDIGDTVTYIRQSINPETKEASIVCGEGKIKAIVLDHESRKIAQIKDGEDVFNVNVKQLNPSQKFKDAFNGFAQEIQRLTDEGNAKSREVIADYNNRITTLVNKTLGEPIQL